MSFNISVVTKSSHDHHHHHHEEEEAGMTRDQKLDVIEACLRAHFDETQDMKTADLVEVDRKKLEARLQVDNEDVTINLADLTITCSNEDIKSRIQLLLQELMLSLMPIGKTWQL